MISFVALPVSMELIFTVSVGEPEKMSNEALSGVNINEYLSVAVFDGFVQTKGETVDESGCYVGTMQSSPVVCHFKYNPAW